MADVNYIDEATIKHIFRGSNNGGVHHISGIIADPDTYKIVDRVEIPNTNGVYRAKVHKNGIEMHSPHPNGKSFFPDTWSEEQVIDVVKEAYDNAREVPNATNSWKGVGNGIAILFYKAQNGRIISAFPSY